MRTLPCKTSSSYAHTLYADAVVLSYQVSAHCLLKSNAHEYEMPHLSHAISYRVICITYVMKMIRLF